MRHEETLRLILVTALIVVTGGAAGADEILRADKPAGYA